MSSGNVVFLVFNACDDASPNYGTQNCTTLADGTALSVTIPDIDPPVGFGGITNATLCTPNANGCARVTWNAPASWTDYRGFKIYSVASDNTLTWKKDCLCSGNNCPDAITECNVTGLDAGRTVDFYIRAFDEAGNLNAAVDPLHQSQISAHGRH